MDLTYSGASLTSFGGDHFEFRNLISRVRNVFCLQSTSVSDFNRPMVLWIKKACCGMSRGDIVKEREPGTSRTSGLGRFPSLLGPDL